MKKTALLFVLLAVACTSLFAEDDKRGWQLELKKIALNITSTEVKNADVYQGYPNPRLTADSQSLIQGYFNFGADLHGDKYLWSNTLLMEYGKSKIRPVQGEKLTTESVDKILFNTDYAWRMLKVDDVLGGFDFGPFASGSYETEFTSNATSPRKQAFRERAGFKAFDGKYVKDLYIAAVMEEDLTYSPTSYNTAWEAGLKVEQPIREGVKAIYSGLFRDYFHNSEKRPTDLDYEMELDARMDVLVFENFVVAPFINYYIAQGKYTSELGQNLYVGVSFSWSRIFKAAK